MGVTSYDIRNKLSARFEMYGGKFTVTCGNTTRQFENPNIERAINVIGVFEYLGQNVDVYNIAFNGIDDEDVFAEMLRLAEAILRGDESYSIDFTGETLGPVEIGEVNVYPTCGFYYVYAKVRVRIVGDNSAFGHTIEALTKNALKKALEK